jgi:hypothetical protein
MAFRKLIPPCVWFDDSNNIDLKIMVKLWLSIVKRQDETYTAPMDAFSRSALFGVVLRKIRDNVHPHKRRRKKTCSDFTSSNHLFRLDHSVAGLHDEKHVRGIHNRHHHH